MFCWKRVRFQWYLLKRVNINQHTHNAASCSPWLDFKCFSSLMKWLMYTCASMWERDKQINRQRLRETNREESQRLPKTGTRNPMWPKKKREIKIKIHQDTQSASDESCALSPGVSRSVFGTLRALTALAEMQPSVRFPSATAQTELWMLDCLFHR